MSASQRASSPMWASETSLARMRKQVASREGQRSHETPFLAQIGELARRPHGRLMKDVMRPQLFKSWIALSTRQITIQRISIKGNQLRYPLNRDLLGG